MTEQRYRAVLEVEAGVPVAEVAERFMVSRQAVHRWLGWYRSLGLDGWPTVRIGRTHIRRRRRLRLSVPDTDRDATYAACSGSSRIRLDASVMTPEVASAMACCPTWKCRSATLR
jgi:hypothetical protein